MTVRQEVDPSSESPLRGIKVLEIAQYIAGPYAGQQLADYGAQVIKIERPDHGDPFRVYAGGKNIEDYGFNFRAYNRNKLSVTLDLQKPVARDVFRRLAQQADVVIENFRPGVMDRLGIGFTTLREINPGLIFCSITGFSPDGPYSLRPAFDTVGQALSGIMHMFTDPDKPRVRGPTIADQATALQACNGILSALYGRSRTGEGARIEIAMLDASISFVPDAHCAYTDIGVDVSSETRAAVSQALIMRCSDGLLAIHIGGIEKAWRSLAEVIGQPELIENPLFKERGERSKNWNLLLDVLAPIFQRESRLRWQKLLNERDVTCAPVLTVSEVGRDPEVLHSGLFQHLDHPAAGPMAMLRRVGRINGSRGPAQAAPALLGEHTDNVLGDYGYSAREIDELRSAGVIGSRVETIGKD